jgi:hypothetical protein
MYVAPLPALLQRGRQLVGAPDIRAEKIEARALSKQSWRTPTGEFVSGHFLRTQFASVASLR